MSFRPATVTTPDWPVPYTLGVTLPANVTMVVAVDDVWSLVLGCYGCDVVEHTWDEMPDDRRAFFLPWPATP